jgi:DMSO/TMAO reductase YedYZ molybdopterin-dependent catalytic subunit
MAAFLFALLALAPPTTAEVAVESLPFDPAAWKTRPQVEVKVTERGQTAVYAGVPLRTVLDDQLKDQKGMAGLRSLADAVLLVRAEDGYQATVAATAAAMDAKGERYLLALTRDGKPLAEGQGPVRLIVPGDPEHVRWVRGVVAIDLVRMPRPKAQAKPADGRGR